MLNLFKKILSNATALKESKVSQQNSSIELDTKEGLALQLQDSYNLYMYVERKDEKVKNSDTKLRSIVSFYFAFNSKVFHLGVGVDYDKDFKCAMFFLPYWLSHNMYEKDNIRLDKLKFSPIEFTNKIAIEEHLLKHIKQGLDDNVNHKTKALSEYAEFMDERIFEIREQLFSADTLFKKELNQFKILWEKGVITNTTSQGKEKSRSSKLKI